MLVYDFKQLRTLESCPEEDVGFVFGVRDAALVGRNAAASAASSEESMLNQTWVRSVGFGRGGLLHL